MNERFPWAVWGKKGIQPPSTPEPYELIARSSDFNCEDILCQIVRKFGWNGTGPTPHPDAFVISPVQKSASFALVVRLRDVGADSMRRPHTLKAEAVCVSLPTSRLDATRKLAELLVSAAWNGSPIPSSDDGYVLHPQPAEESLIEAISRLFSESQSSATLFVSPNGNRDCQIPPDWALLNTTGNTITPRTVTAIHNLSSTTPVVTSSPLSPIDTSFPKRGGVKILPIFVGMLLLVGTGVGYWLQHVVIQQLRNANRQLSQENEELVNQRDEIQAECNELRNKSIAAGDLDQIRQRTMETSKSLVDLLKAIDDVKYPPPKIEPPESDR